MTYIEFFDKTSSENICACLVNVPDRVIMLGSKMKLLQKHAERYTKILENRGHQVEFICRSINKHNMQSIVDTLAAIVETYDDCVFDLTGGDDLYLVATGVISERYKEKNIQMHRYNISSNTIVDCDQDGTTIMENALPEMTVEENIRAYGGDIIREETQRGGTYAWNLDNEFKTDVRTMWNICKHDVRLWNTQIGVLEVAEYFRDASENELTTSASVSCVSDYLKKHNAKLVFLKGILGRLRDSGLISEYVCDEETIRITYKNEQIKRCLTKAGQALEMRIYLAAQEVRDSNGKYIYNDVMNGVCIDWDGEIHENNDAHDTKNEVDVIMMHGILPVFVSCKNGYVDINELYKLDSVADKFGQKYAKKVLVATALDTAGDYAEYVRQRAADMNIRLVEGVQDMDDDELARVMKSLWSN